MITESATKQRKGNITLTWNDKPLTPVKPKELSKAVFEELNVELMISGNTATSPKKTRRKVAMTKAIRKNAIQM